MTFKQPFKNYLKSNSRDFLIYINFITYKLESNTD